MHSVGRRTQLRIVRRREKGIALVMMLILGVGLMFLATMSLEMSLMRVAAMKTQRESLLARQIADSAVSQALAQIKEAGMTQPRSGGGTNAAWVSFAGGGFYYYTTFDAVNDVSVIRAWGRVASDSTLSSSTVSPDNVGWDGTGWLVEGLEVTIRAQNYIPEQPLYFGNGGLERPLGGFSWDGGSDPADPSTWQTVTSSPSSWQTSDGPFAPSALNHPADYLYLASDDPARAPEPVGAYPHQYQVFGSQNTIGQFNAKAWFTNSAGASNTNSKAKVVPPPNSNNYAMDDASPDSPFPVDSSAPDVQTWAHELWNKYKDDSSATKLSGGSNSGTYGDFDNPGITFVTGELDVNSGDTFRGAGILVIRDDYDPNTSTNNTPSTKAGMRIGGTFEWTGLVIVAGWAPHIGIEPGGDATIVGSLFGEDSVQSGGEVSLDSATITLVVEDDFRVLYSNSIFGPGGLIHHLLPEVVKEVVGIREI